MFSYSWEGVVGVLEMVVLKMVVEGLYWGVEVVDLLLRGEGVGVLLLREAAEEVVACLGSILKEVAEQVLL